MSFPTVPFKCTISIRTFLWEIYNICKPEEGWSGLPKYSLQTFSLHVVITCAVVFGLLFFFSLDIIADYISFLKIQSWQQAGSSFTVFAIYFFIVKQHSSLRKQPTFGDATTCFPTKWRLRKEPRNSILMTRHYPDLVALLIGWIKFPTRHDQSEAQPKSGKWRVISMEFLRSFLRRHLAGKPVVASPNVGCFLRLTKPQQWIELTDNL